MPSLPLFLIYKRAALDYSSIAFVVMIEEASLLLHWTVIFAPGYRVCFGFYADPLSCIAKQKNLDFSGRGMMARWRGEPSAGI